MVPLVLTHSQISRETCAVNPFGCSRGLGAVPKMAGTQACVFRKGRKTRSYQQFLIRHESFSHVALRGKRSPRPPVRGGPFLLLEAHLEVPFWSRVVSKKGGPMKALKGVPFLLCGDIRQKALPWNPSFWPEAPKWSFAHFRGPRNMDRPSSQSG